MKHLIVICLLLLAGAVKSQNLIGKIEGKWNIEKYSSTIKTEKDTLSGTIEFKPDGKFISEGFYFGTQMGSFRTDETRHVLVIETERGITEWQVYLKKKVLRLLAVPEDEKGKVFLILSKAE